MQYLTNRARRARGIPLLLLATALGACSADGNGVDLFPLYRNVGDDRAGEVAVLFPLSDFEWDEDGRRSWIVPLWFHSDHAAGDSTTLAPMLPLWFARVQGDTAQHALVPLWHRLVTPGRVDRGLLLGLVSWSRVAPDDHLAAHALWPLYAYAEERAGARFSLLRALELSPTGPLVGVLDVDRTGLAFGAEADERALSIDFAHVLGRLVQVFHHDDEGTHVDTRFLTFFANEDWSIFQRRVPHLGLAGADRTRFDLWPFYSRETDGDQVTRRAFAFPLLRLVDEPERELEQVDVLWPLLGRATERGQRRTWFHPLFQVENGPERSAWHVLLGMFGRAREPGVTTWRILWFPWRRAAADATPP